VYEGFWLNILKDDDEAPYQLGPYSRQRAIEQGKIEQSHWGVKIGQSQHFLDTVDFFDLERVMSTSNWTIYGSI
jgi:hypothetical protein